MPKRPSDSLGVVAEMSAERTIRKTERSHEENQERAYIAASRRADRSIEARVQSARMASEIHKKRTGKGFKISEEIVIREEMYEEEDDDMPRHYRHLASHLVTNSPVMNSRVSAYLSSQVAVRAYALEQENRQREVDRMFAEQFPHASHLTQLSQSMYYQPLRGNQATSPMSPQFSGPFAQSPTSPIFSRERSQSVSQGPVMSPPPSFAPQQHQSPGTAHIKVEGQTSPPPLTPGSIQNETTQSHQPSMASFVQSYSSYAPSATSNIPVDPSLTMSPSSTSVFTSELPPETKMMVNLDPNDSMYPYLMGGMECGELMGSGATYFSPFHSTGKESQGPPMGPEGLYSPATSAAHLPTSNTFSMFAGEENRTDTPAGGDGFIWDQWINNASDPDWADVNTT